jgi:hypothetical protein
MKESLHQRTQQTMTGKEQWMIPNSDNINLRISCRHATEGHQCVQKECIYLVLGFKYHHACVSQRIVQKNKQRAKMPEYFGLNHKNIPVTRNELYLEMICNPDKLIVAQNMSFEKKNNTMRKKWSMLSSFEEEICKKEDNLIEKEELDKMFKQYTKRKEILLKKIRNEATDMIVIIEQKKMEAEKVKEQEKQRKEELRQIEIKQAEMKEIEKENILRREEMKKEHERMDMEFEQRKQELQEKIDRLKAVDQV